MMNLWLRGKQQNQKSWIYRAATSLALYCRDPKKEKEKKHSSLKTGLGKPPTPYKNNEH